MLFPSMRSSICNSAVSGIEKLGNQAAVLTISPALLGRSKRDAWFANTINPPAGIDIWE